MPTYETPGVIIEEQTGPGVIAGVGTSTAAFLGPALAGPIAEPHLINSYEDFLRLYAPKDGDGNPQSPHIVNPQRFFLPLAVKGFFDNGGLHAYIVRVGTAGAAVWKIQNQDSQTMFQLRAKTEGSTQVRIDVAAAHSAATKVAIGDAEVDTPGPQLLSAKLKVANPFQVGDTVQIDGGSAETKVTKVDGLNVELEKALTGLKATDHLRIADLTTARESIRLEDTKGLYPGSLVKISEGGNDVYAVLSNVDKAGFVTFAATPARTQTISTKTAPTLESQEISLTVTSPSGAAKIFDNLSDNPSHPGYVFSKLQSDWVDVLPPAQPVTTGDYGKRLVKAASPLSPSPDGKPDDLTNLGVAEFEAGLNALANVDEVNILCAPDAALLSQARDIQQAMILHCEKLKDRFAVLDSWLGITYETILDQRKEVPSERGYAALYFPWVEVRDPLNGKSTLFIPPSGQIAGAYARTDQERGVHKAPANTDLRGVLGLQVRLSDAQQGTVNLKGVNVLRVFPDSAAVKIWGARTTVDPTITDWTYVNVRRLMLFIEESIQEGIRWAVFEPNNLTLWQQLKRTINDFLGRVWRDGALFGDTAEKAFRVRIDEALNPPSTRALGQLFIEIAVAPVRPAEFIIVRIGQWDGGGEVKEG